ncbi:hypothetical protein TNCT_188521 [Trichonephila clavata]|uniref:Uncharacterized protein n=1 Tax=Trichonephila clavata TaxID=2740835 RepID=A0A8X6FGK1_TRICU|nr:hypothetical protein TNCT_188521 [Trichonephila clavata]
MSSSGLIVPSIAHEEKETSSVHSLQKHFHLSTKKPPPYYFHPSSSMQHIHLLLAEEKSLKFSTMIRWVNEKVDTGHDKSFLQFFFYGTGCFPLIDGWNERDIIIKLQ